MRPMTDTKYLQTLRQLSVDAEVFRTPDGIPYLKDPGVVLLGQTSSHVEGIRRYLKGLDESFVEYLNDPVVLNAGAQLSKVAGQLCYQSFDENATKNKDAKRYFDNIKKQKHGSVLEHAVYTVLLYGIDRAVTHELVRHRAGTAFSQVSQRFVASDRVRYVMQAELQGVEAGEKMFFRHVLANRDAYEERTEWLSTQVPPIEGESKRDRRKRVQSGARRALANEAEAPIIVSGNVRTWRHIFTKRCAHAADRAIRAPMIEVFRILKEINPEGFDDFADTTLPDGTRGLIPETEGV